MLSNLLRHLIESNTCELNKSHIISTDEDPGLRMQNLFKMQI
jgi:hypothetical protein